MQGDAPDVAWIFEHGVWDGDLIIMGTDGLFDNLDDGQIL